MCQIKITKYDDKWLSVFYQSKHNWVCNIRKELGNIDLNDLWNSQAMLSNGAL
jgi:hypothetical protein